MGSCFSDDKPKRTSNGYLSTPEASPHAQHDAMFLERPNAQAARSSNVTQLSSNVTQLSSLDLSKVMPHDYYQGEYDARVMDVYDGDTFTVAMQLKHEVKSYRIRLMGVDCPELKGESKDAGHSAKAEMLTFIGAKGAINLPLRNKTRAWFQANVINVRIRFAERKPSEGEKFGRQLAHLLVNGKSLGEHLIATSHAKPYFGGTKE